MKKLSFKALKNNVKFLLKNDLKYLLSTELDRLKNELSLYKILAVGNTQPQTKDVIEYLKNLSDDIFITDEQIIAAKKHLVFNKIVNIADNDFREKYKTEINNLKESGSLSVFPYKQVKRLKNFVSGYDEIKKLPFVVHENKRLYFPKNYAVEKARSEYAYYIQSENILCGDYMEKSPHQYESQNYYVEESDVLIDIGCAEALFALHHIEKVKKVYLVESKELWKEALTATFEPYSTKVCIINQFISDTISDTSITIDSILKTERLESIFIKMDIEGNEKKVVGSCIDFLGKEKIDHIKICCCVYHCQEDAEHLEKLFNLNNFSTEFSEGFMLFYFDNLQYPYFRKGILRAKKQA